MSNETKHLETLPAFQGKKEFIKHLNKERLTLRQATLAVCYDCSGFYSDGRKDCEVPDCPLWPFMPYRRGGTQKKTRTLTDGQKEQIKARLRRGAPSGLDANTAN